MTGELINRALSLCKNGQLAEAEQVLRQVIAAGANDFQVQYLYAGVLYEQQKVPEALTAVEAALKQSPDAGEAMMLHGLLLHAANRPLEALNGLSKVVALTPNHADAWYNHGVVLSELDRSEEAVASFDRALAIHPTPLAWNHRGASLRQLGHLDEALESFEATITLDPNFTMALFNRGSVLRQLHRLEEALTTFEKVLAMEPGLFDAWINHGAVLFEMARRDEALASYDHALTLQPNSVEAWRYRGGTLQNMQRLEEAVASYDQVLAIDPDDSSALLQRGSLLCEMNRVPEGFEVLSRYAARVYGAAPSDEPTAPDHKQRHDREQREYLAAQGVEAGSFHIAGGARLGGPAVNPANREIVASEWANSNPQMVVIDNLLTEEALDGLRRFCWGSTVWRKHYEQGGYLGAFDEDGFACPLLAQIADEMREVFPAAIAGHGLARTWAFKYDSSLGGIRVHGDQAAVNVNFWITPNDSNLNPDSGGMVIWDTAAPTDWEFARYNKDNDAIYAFLAGAGAKSTTIPHRSNRAVVFDSDLFHKTDKIEFKDGYLDRRINVTMLYGRRNSLNN